MIKERHPKRKASKLRFELESGPGAKKIKTSNPKQAFTHDFSGSFCTGLFEESVLAEYNKQYAASGP